MRIDAVKKTGVCKWICNELSKVYLGVTGGKFEYCLADLKGEKATSQRIHLRLGASWKDIINLLTVYKIIKLLAIQIIKRKET